jgi:phosphotriesterase-related protein
MLEHISPAADGDGREIATVTGPTAIEALRPILYHEHVVLDLRHVPRAQDLWLHDVDLMVRELAEFVRCGGRAVVSLTNGSMGRDIARLREISKRSEVKILVATGQYTRLASAPIHDAQLLAQTFVDEISLGIDGTGVRAAVIGEIATGPHPISEYERLLFQAAALAHRATGAPIATHTHNGRYARWQLRYLMSLGVPPDRVVIGHMDGSVKDGTPDVSCMADLAAQGAFIGIDTIGLANYYSENLGRRMPSDEARADAIAQLVEGGWADQIVIAQDICRPMHLKGNGGAGYGHIHDVFLPLLEARGVDRATSARFLGDNTLRWLAGTP